MVAKNPNGINMEDRKSLDTRFGVAVSGLNASKL